MTTQFQNIEDKDHDSSGNYSSHSYPSYRTAGIRKPHRSRLGRRFPQHEGIKLITDIPVEEKDEDNNILPIGKEGSETSWVNSTPLKNDFPTVPQPKPSSSFAPVEKEKSCYPDGTDSSKINAFSITPLKDIFSYGFQTQGSYKKVGVQEKPEFSPRHDFPFAQKKKLIGSIFESPACKRSMLKENEQKSIILKDVINFEMLSKNPLIPTIYNEEKDNQYVVNEKENYGYGIFGNHGKKVNKEFCKDPSSVNIESCEKEKLITVDAVNKCTSVENVPQNKSNTLPENQHRTCSNTLVNSLCLKTNEIIQQNVQKQPFDPVNHKHGSTKYQKAEDQDIKLNWPEFSDSKVPVSCAEPPQQPNSQPKQITRNDVSNQDQLVVAPINNVKTRKENIVGPLVRGAEVMQTVTQEKPPVGHVVNRITPVVQGYHCTNPCTELKNSSTFDYVMKKPITPAIESEEFMKPSQPNNAALNSVMKKTTTPAKGDNDLMRPPSQPNNSTLNSVMKKPTTPAKGGDDLMKPPSQPYGGLKSAATLLRTQRNPQFNQAINRNNVTVPKLMKFEWKHVNNKQYVVLSTLGKGGSSEVYLVLDPENNRLMAMKCVNLSQVEKVVSDGYLNEVELLLKLQGCESVIRIFDHEHLEQDKMLYVLMEKGDTDLSKLIHHFSKMKRISMIKVIDYWIEMLYAVKDIHDKGIIHSDLKPANFLLVSGRLKLIDFGIASSIQGDMTSVHKEVATGTWNYMSPEAIRNNDKGSARGCYKINYKSDVWSLGCILYNLVYGKTPFSHITNTFSKLTAIVNDSHAIEFPEEANGKGKIPHIILYTLKSCLKRDPKLRPTVHELLSYQYHAQDNDVSVQNVGHQIRAILPTEEWEKISHLFPENKV